MKNRGLNRFRKWHRWPGLVVGVLFLVWALSGIVLNHRETFSGWSVNRDNLAKEYQYGNWNNASVKGTILTGNDSLLLYGNIGVWKSGRNMDRFISMNEGFGKGIDRRKVTALHLSEQGHLYAGTLFGLYCFDDMSNHWSLVDLPFHNSRICDIQGREGKIYVMGRSAVAEIQDVPGAFRPRHIQLPPPIGYDNKAGLFKTLWIIHSGEIYGQAGKLIVDASGIIFILLTLTGLIRFFAPKIIRRRKTRGKDPIPVARVKKMATKWHKVAGIWTVAVLVITASTGMFLRPPLLIAIASSKVNKIKYSVLDTDNAWFDKLRAFVWDEEMARYIVSTSEGLYFVDGDFSHPPEMVQHQPPVSVMGINVFNKMGNRYLVGSFSGLFIWDPVTGLCMNAVTGQPANMGSTTGKPIGTELVSGWIDRGDGQLFYMDYDAGAINLTGGEDLPEMPPGMKASSPMSLWNFALEVHTARIFRPILGSMYILIVPLLGLWGILILVTGLVVWIKLFNRRRRSGRTCHETRSPERRISPNFKQATKTL